MKNLKSSIVFLAKLRKTIELFNLCLKSYFKINITIRFLVFLDKVQSKRHLSFLDAKKQPIYY